MKQSEKHLEISALATVKELTEFFRISRGAVPSLMSSMGIPKRGSGYPWVRIWSSLGFDVETVKTQDLLKEPMLELKEVADLLGESPKTTRRHGDGKYSDKSMPAHVDLGPRKRLYFRAEILAWMYGETLTFDRKKVSLNFRMDSEKSSNQTRKKSSTATSKNPALKSAVSMFLKP